jgi:LTXXQ motif family protein
LQPELLHYSAVESDAATDRRTVMRPRTIPIIAAVAFSLAVPTNADARPRFGPAVLLGAVAGVLFGGFRHSSRHYRRSATHAAVGPRRSARAARMERRTAISARQPPTRAPAVPTAAVPPERTAPVAPEQAAAQTAALPPERAAPIPPERTAAIFWPDAARDLVEYVLLPAGNDRFWAYGYDAVVQGAFAPSDADDRRGARNRPAANQVSDATSPATAPVSSFDLCGNVAAEAGADALIERIERAVEPTASQRDALEQLRAAVAQAIERIQATCPAAAPATLAQRLTAIQDRIWAMHDALFTLRLPFENFSNSLTDEQQRRLRGGAPESAQSGADATDARAQTCAEPAAGIADGIMRAIGRAAPPSGPQRAGLDALRLNSAAMAKLVAGSCPADPLLSPMGRFAAATDRLDLMLFAAMNMGPALQQLYDSLDDKQKADFNRALRQGRQSGPAGGRS